MAEPTVNRRIGEVKVNRTLDGPCASASRVALHLLLAWRSACSWPPRCPLAP